MEDNTVQFITVTISVFAPGLFDNLTSQTVLELKEVRDATSEVMPSGSPSQSSTEVIIRDNLVNLKNKEQPEYNLREAKELFKKLKKSLKKLDTDPHLENQEADSIMLDLDSKLFWLKKNSIKTLQGT